jgi:hypothetical protein
MQGNAGQSASGLIDIRGGGQCNRGVHGLTVAPRSCRKQGHWREASVLSLGDERQSPVLIHLEPGFGIYFRVGIRRYALA